MSSPLPACYFTPNELIHRYPQVENLTWNASKIGTFFSAGLLKGKRRILKSCILESSFLDLVAYADKITEKKRINLQSLTNEKHNFLTPDELIHEYPQVMDELDWNASKIGIFYSSGLLLGHRSGRENKALIAQDSFIELLNYATIILLDRH